MPIPRINFHYLTLLVILLVSASCSFSDDVNINGRIDENTLHNLKKRNLENYNITISSAGGDVKPAIETGIYLQEKHTSLTVKRECISACAEFILPSANNIVFYNNPIIGFHWNPAMNFDQMKRFKGDTNNCDLSTRDMQLELYEKKNLNRFFWKQTEKWLVLESYQVVPKENSCAWKRRKFQNHMWLPTSKQLREHWGLNFTGSVCSDKKLECKLKINSRWKKGTRVVIGDELYVSKGR